MCHQSKITDGRAPTPLLQLLLSAPLLLMRIVLFPQRTFHQFLVRSTRKGPLDIPNNRIADVPLNLEREPPRLDAMALSDAPTTVENT